MASVISQMVNAVTKQKDFPTYENGDVLIILHNQKEYRLHSTTLRERSAFFHAILIDENASQPGPKARQEPGVIRWRLELQLELQFPGKHLTEIGELRVRYLNAKSEPHGPPIARGPYKIGGDIIPLYSHYDNLFRCLFYQPLNLDTSSFATTLRDVESITRIAEHLGSISAVASTLDIALLTSGDVLYRSIATNAVAWADLGLRIQSEILFRESIIHLVGQWTPRFCNQPELLSKMRIEVKTLCEHKAQELEKRKQQVEMRILGHYPSDLAPFSAKEQNVGAGSRTTRGQGKPTRTDAYTSRIMDWMALCLYRHWMGQMLANEMTRQARDGGLAFYQAVSRGGEAYIDQLARESFVQNFPLSAKSRTNFDVALTRIKECMKPFIAPLLEQKCTLDTKKWPVEWLTCTMVEKKDCPWMEEESEQASKKGEHNSSGSKQKESGSTEISKKVANTQLGKSQASENLVGNSNSQSIQVNMDRLTAVKQNQVTGDNTLERSRTDTEEWDDNDEDPMPEDRYGASTSNSKMLAVANMYAVREEGTAGHETAGYGVSSVTKTRINLLTANAFDPPRQSASANSNGTKRSNLQVESHEQAIEDESNGIAKSIESKLNENQDSAFLSTSRKRRRLSSSKQSPFVFPSSPFKTNSMQQYRRRKVQQQQQQSQEPTVRSTSETQSDTRMHMGNKRGGFVLSASPSDGEGDRNDIDQMSEEEYLAEVIGFSRRDMEDDRRDKQRGTEDGDISGDDSDLTEDDCGMDSDGNEDEDRKGVIVIDDGKCLK